MGRMKLTIQHNDILFEPPVESGVKIEWERTGSPGKLTFTMINMGTKTVSFGEGDRVCFYYDDKLVFVGYVFTKKRDRENIITVTCYDQIRYLKNKFTYVFENKTATQIIEALCKDFSLKTGSMDNTNYVIPAVAEENKSALDIILGILEDTLLNTGQMFVLYDECGSIRVRNCANMIINQLIMEETAENFDYSSSIDSETYNNIVLYYKNDDKKITLYTASNEDKIKQWGLLRYFEEVKNKTAAQNKANSLLNMYCKKTRELKINGAFGNTSVRGGSLIPVDLNLGDVIVKNYMLVESVTHNFEDNQYTMDITVSGGWANENIGEITSSVIGETSSNTTSGSSVSSNSGNSGGNSSSNNSNENSSNNELRTARIEVIGPKDLGNHVGIGWKDKNGVRGSTKLVNGIIHRNVTTDQYFGFNILCEEGHSFEIVSMSGNWYKYPQEKHPNYCITGDGSYEMIIKWVR